MRRASVVVFIITDFGRSDGAVLWAANMLSCLARVPNVDFTIVTSGPDEVRGPNQRFISELGLEHIFVPFRKVTNPGGNATFARLAAIADRARTILSEKYYFLLERDARKQDHVDSEVLAIIRTRRPDLVIINGRNASLHIRSVLSLSTPFAFITLDNEIAYQRLHRSQAGPLGEAMSRRLERWICRHGNLVADMRFRRYVARLYERCVGVVALSRNDMPADLPDRVVRAVIPPVLRRSDLLWRYQGRRCVLFVGNIHVLKIVHVANRLAIEWICSRFAPELSLIDATARVLIIGANADDVPSNWQHPNIVFMGRGDKGELLRQITTVDLFIAPIANNMGAKLKLAECVSHGTPFLATHAAMSGLPFLSAMPQIDLDQPGAAARRAVEYMNTPHQLIKLSQSILAQAERARTEQDVAWATFLEHSMCAVPKAGRSKEAISDVAANDCSTT